MCQWALSQNTLIFLTIQNEVLVGDMWGSEHCNTKKKLKKTRHNHNKSQQNIVATKYIFSPMI